MSAMNELNIAIDEYNNSLAKAEHPSEIIELNNTLRATVDWLLLKL